MRSFVTLVAAVTPIAIVAGCTFLIPFEEAPPDASTNNDAGRDTNEPNAEASADDGPVPFPPPCDPTFPLTEVRCNPSFPRPNCASNTAIFPTYPAGRERNGDLVTCNGGTTPTCVQKCPFGCAAMPVGYPDACDDCEGRPDGTYCVKDLRGYDGRTFGLAIDCEEGRMVLAHVCGENRCATQCPRASPKPSCCIQCGMERVALDRRRTAIPRERGHDRRFRRWFVAVVWPGECNDRDS